MNSYSHLHGREWLQIHEAALLAEVNAVLEASKRSEIGIGERLAGRPGWRREEGAWLKDRVLVAELPSFKAWQRRCAFDAGRYSQDRIDAAIYIVRSEPSQEFIPRKRNEPILPFVAFLLN